MAGMGVGCILNLPFAPVHETGFAFHKFIAGVSLAFLSIGYALLWTHPNNGDIEQILSFMPEFLSVGIVCVVIGLLFILVAHSYQWITFGRISLGMTSAVGMGVLAASGFILFIHYHSTRQNYALAALSPLTVVMSAFLVATTLVGMLVGHAYLRNRAMPFATLQRMARVYAWALGVRFALYLLAFFLVYVPLWKASPFSSEMLIEQHLPFQLLRVLAGFILSAPLAYMILKCADLRSNQSATGILYVAVVFALIGELVGFYYFGQTGVPL